jgi:uncharacterized protein
MTVVLDTNILVSGLLCAFGAPAEIVRMASSGGLRLCYDARVLSEYREVLSRTRFGFLPSDVDALLDHIASQGVLVAGVPLHEQLPDPDDEAFLEVALAGNATCLVTGNVRHYPASARSGMTVLPPAAFLRYYAEKTK